MTHLSPALGILAVIVGCSGPTDRSTTDTKPTAKTAVGAPPAPIVDAEIVAPAFATSAPCGNLTLSLAPGVPGDVASQTDQLDFDCFAWQEFIALNWPADPASSFGDPNDQGPTTWETFMSADTLFDGNGQPPPAWGTQPPLPAACQALPAAVRSAAPSAHALTMTTKFSNLFDVPVASAQATSPPNWLGAQNGTNLWYDVRISKDEYEYLANLYTPALQLAVYEDSKTARIELPPGVMKFGKTSAVGSIELKAAWMVVTDPANPRWARYKKTQAFTYDPDNDTCALTTVALIALHIIHKTSSQPTWVWATFEHIDNLPPSGGGTPPGGYYNLAATACQSKSVAVPDAACLASGASSPVTIGCEPNTKPGYNLGPTCPAPVAIQVDRVMPVNSDATTANAAAQALITGSDPTSVWQYYALVDVLWSTSPTSGQKREVPLTFASPQPPRHISNAALETYTQSLTCIDCHASATIADSDSYGADFSFVLRRAAAQAQAAKRTMMLGKAATAASAHQ